MQTQDKETTGRGGVWDARGLALTPVATCVLLFQGVVEWYLAALFIKHLGPMGVFEGVWLPLLYGLAVPFILPAVLLARWSVGYPKAATVVPVAIVSATATLCDGIAIAWFQSAIYGPDPAIVALGGGWLLWGIGVGLFISVAMSLRPSVKRGD
ncbi:MULTISPECIES: hypothetical protein [unclassified Sphingomonas]|jgi:hypothetical protein|uniref:hypothetical protein n=1 Tax=unclassified Sphingomonas TaxID=196159 RepID=UPI0008316839|nr:MULTISPECIES: hypothetical protein [unclassified Sphingomonas]MCH4893652.1 hypothetical protein [Sphingomonas sp. SFZ2018-12]